MAGLAAALYLHDDSRRIVVLERDAPPPDIDPIDAFEAWARPGVPQFRHAHVLMGRFRSTLRDEHPALLTQLERAGLETSTLSEVLPETQIEGFAPEPGDDDLLHLWGRRPTFEYAFRRYVAGLPGVEFIHEVQVTGLLNRCEQDCVYITGVRYEQDGEQHSLAADTVVDASGKRSRSPGWLGELGVRVDAERHPSLRTYVCRHYRRNHPEAPRPRRGTGANLDYFAFVVFHGEAGHFAVAMSAAAAEEALATWIKRADGFEALCNELPLLRAQRTDSQPTSKVLGAGNFENRWSHFASAGGRTLAGFFPLGDVQIETNPVYGRGCTSALLQARALSATLAAQPDPRLRTRAYADRCRTAMRAHFDFAVFSDHMFDSRARLARGEKVPFGERLLHFAYDRIWGPALERSPVCAREMVRAMEMRDMSPLPTRLVSAAHVVFYGLSSGFRPKVKLAQQGPPREELLMRLALPATTVPDSEPEPANG